MTPQPNHYAIYTGGFKPVVVQIKGISANVATVQEGAHRQLRVLLAELPAYGPDKERIETAVKAMIQTALEGDRRRAKARNWVKDENERIVREVMNHE